MPVSRTLPEHVQNLPVGLYPEQHVGDRDVLEFAFLGVGKIHLEAEMEMSKFDGGSGSSRARISKLKYEFRYAIPQVSISPGPTWGR